MPTPILHTRVCLRCRVRIAASEFIDSGGAKRKICKTCRYSQSGQLGKLWRQEHPREAKLRKKKYHLKERGLTLGDFSCLLGRQKARCAICGAALSMMPHRPESCMIDHDHITGKTRGLLCLNCNIALGHVQDNPSRLRLMVAYLDKFRDVESVEAT